MPGNFPDGGLAFSFPAREILRCHPARFALPVVATVASIPGLFVLHCIAGGRLSRGPRLGCLFLNVLHTVVFIDSGEISRASP